MSSDSFKSIFSTLTENSTSSSNNPPDPNGWTWACDELGNFTACSPEVEKILGIPPGEFLGRSLTNFALPPHSGQAIETALNESESPAELHLEYQHRNGKLIPVTLYLITTLSRKGDVIGWHGFTHTLLSPEQEPTGEEEPKQDFTKLASAIILDILGDIRKNHPSIIEFAKSSVTVKEHQAAPGAAGPPISPGQQAQEIEHKLIWGNKLDFDYEEDLFIRKNRFRSAGPRGHMQRLLAPGKIVKSDLRWFAVVIRVEEEKSYIWVSYKRANVDRQKVDMGDFLHNPDIILREISNAINNPWKKITIYEAGKDYLRSPDT